MGIENDDDLLRDLEQALGKAWLRYKKQNAPALRRLFVPDWGGRVAIELKDYRDLSDESFGKIVSVGMFEHVGRGHLLTGPRCSQSGLFGRRMAFYLQR